MYKNFDIPFYNEGWDDIKIWYNDKEYKSAYGFWLDFIFANRDFDQESKWHTKTLGDHCRECSSYVLDNTADFDGNTSVSMVIAAGLHDCGKLFVKDFHDSRGNVSEYAHYYNHENVGSYNSLFYGKDGFADNLLVAALIRYHMVLHFFKDWKQKTIDKYEKEFTSHKYLKEMKFYEALKILHEGDKKAH
jgi:hypothetical protein